MCVQNDLKHEQVTQKIFFFSRTKCTSFTALKNQIRRKKNIRKSISGYNVAEIDSISITKSHQIK